MKEKETQNDVDPWTNDAKGDSRLTGLDDDFGSADHEEREFDSVPDGKYQVNVERAELSESKAGNLMLKWTLRILGPKHRGRLLWRNNMLQSKENLRWLKHDLYLSGLKLEKLSDLPKHLDKLLDVKLEVTKKTKGDFENVFFNKLLVLASDAEAQSDSSDDIPF